DLPRPQERAVVGSVYAAGSPLSDLSVDLVPVDGAHGASSGTTDADGRFRLRLGAAGKYRLAVRGAGISETRVLDVREDQSRQVNFDVGDAAVRGRLVTPKGSGRPRIALQRERDRERDALWRVAPSETSADAGGRFSFERVAPGRYRVLVFDPDRRLASVASEPFDLAADAVRNLEIDVPLASPLVVSVDDPSTRAGSGRLWITAEEATVPLACLAQAWLFPAVPALAVHGLPPGRYRLRMPAFEDLVVELREGGSATNAVLHPAREPAASRRVGAAYDSRESAIEKSWDWGDEVPWLFEEETLSSSR
ncbi:MAG TPA: carboxypeptidase regulatory-like domain-containing protein, partial [Planctomycetota bacterium]|nr:carboxypeptidase regulatory-like domain-containing protein [Planctomycetota bacterium]